MFHSGVRGNVVAIQRTALCGVVCLDFIYGYAVTVVNRIDNCIRCLETCLRILIQVLILLHIRVKSDGDADTSF